MKYYVAVHLINYWDEHKVFIAEGSEADIKREIAKVVSGTEDIHHWEIFGSKDTPEELVESLLEWISTWLGEEEEH